MRLDKDLKGLGSNYFFVKDIFTDDFIYGITVRSTIPKGKIKSISLPGLPDDYLAVTARDIPGENLLTLFQDSMPVLAGSEVDYIGQPILLMAGPDRDILKKLAKEVHIEYEEEAATFYTKELTPFNTLTFNKGQCEEVFDRPHKIVTGEYKTGFQNTYHLITQSVFSYYEPKKNLIIFSSSEYPFHVRQSVATLLGLSPQKVRVIVPHKGSGLGGKIIYPSLVAGHGALLSHMAKKSVKILYDFDEELLYAPHKYPCSILYKSALNEEGQLQALSVEIHYDSGAYTLITPLILERLALSACGVYRCENVRVIAKSYKTNNVPAFSFSSLGEDLACFAMELHASKMVAVSELSPYTWRKNNLVKGGDSLALGQKVPKGDNVLLLLEDVIQRSDFERKFSAFEANRKGREDLLSPSKPLWGIGLALTYHGIGIQNAYEAEFPSNIKVTLDAHKKLHLFSSFVSPWVEFIFRTIAKRVLKIEREDIIIELVDTNSVPDTGPAMNSRLTAIASTLIEHSCQIILKKQAESLADSAKDSTKLIEVKQKHLINKQQLGSKKTLTGSYYSALCWEATVVEVVVDPISLKPFCKQIWTTIEAGKISEPLRMLTEVEGAIIHNLEFALLNRLARDLPYYQEQIHSLPGFYIKDRPLININFLELETNRKSPDFKGLGDQGALGVAPAFTAAVSQALGLPITEIPLTLDYINKLILEAQSVKTS
jgi:CO/xanthine dehydrogenase Mo-binding subunit